MAYCMLDCPEPSQISPTRTSTSSTVPSPSIFRIPSTTLADSAGSKKKVHSSPDWLKTDAVNDIYSVSNCVSGAFCDYIPHWRHNGYWLFDSPELIREIASAEKLDLSDQTFFYYEVHEQQFDDEIKSWQPFSADTSFPTDVQVPVEKKIEGFDVVSFFALSAPSMLRYRLGWRAATMAPARSLSTSCLISFS